MNTTEPTLGLDIAQTTFMAVLFFSEKKTLRQAFPNTPSGFRKLERWLHQHFAAASMRAGLECTNTYWEQLAYWLHAHGHTVLLLNPERIAHYAKSIGRRNKTDPVDACIIAQFVARHDGTVWVPPSPEQKSLRSLTRTRQQLTQLANAVSNQIRTAGAEGRHHLELVLKKIRQQLKAIAAEIATYLKAHPDFQQQVHCLTSFKSVGLVTAAVLVAELPAVSPQTDPRTICAWAALTPRRWQSGKVEAPAHLGRKGNAFVRQALYMPALVAKRYNPCLRAFAENLAARGKTTGCILGAISHKMLRILVGMLRHRTLFDPNRLQKKI